MHQNDINTAERNLIIGGAAIILGVVAFITISFSFAALAPDLFLTGYLGVAVPAILIPIFLSACLKERYRKEHDYFSVLSSAENLSNQTKQAYSSIFKEAENKVDGIGSNNAEDQIASMSN